MLNLKFNSEEEFQDYFFGENAPKEKIYNAIVRSIEKAIMNGSDTAHFASMEFIDTGEILDIKSIKEEFNLNLQEALNYFAEEEKYERCAQIKKLMDINSDENE